MKIHSIASYVPEHLINNIDQAQAFGESEEFVRSKIGAVNLPRKEICDETSDLAVRAVQALFAQGSCSATDIDVLIVVTQNGDGHNLPHTSALVHKKLNLPRHVAVFDVSLGCSGYVYGLQILKSFLKESHLKKGILVTADPYSKIIDSTDRSTAMLFGDAATATLISEDGYWDLSKPIFGSDGQGAEHIHVEDKFFKMNGRQVFNFALTVIPKEIKSLLLQEKLSPEDIDVFCLHQGSAGIVDAISRSFPSVKHKFKIDMENLGNTVSSSIPLLLEEEILNKGFSKILISGFGVGLSWGSMVLYRKEY
jgi:3-oxoacyl-[acyl-carrier-protein] synthase-3